MTILLWLYPAAWRRRYGDEVARMLEGRAFSLRVAVDLVAGAIDTWLHPAQTLAAAHAAASGTTPEDRTMLSKILRLDCAAAYGLTREEQKKAAVSIIAWTLVVTAIWLAFSIRFPKDPRVESLSMLPLMFSIFYSLRYTYLKGRPASVQAIFIAGMTLAMAAFFLAVGWVADLI
jgi:hypothetical protein